MQTVDAFIRDAYEIILIGQSTYIPGNVTISRSHSAVDTLVCARHLCVMRLKSFDVHVPSVVSFRCLQIGVAFVVCPRTV